MDPKQFLRETKKFGRKFKEGKEALKNLRVKIFWLCLEAQIPMGEGTKGIRQSWQDDTSRKVVGSSPSPGEGF